MGHYGPKLGPPMDQQTDGISATSAVKPHECRGNSATSAVGPHECRGISATFVGTDGGLALRPGYVELSWHIRNYCTLLFLAPPPLCVFQSQCPRERSRKVTARTHYSHRPFGQQLTLATREAPFSYIEVHHLLAQALHVVAKRLLPFLVLHDALLDLHELTRLLREDDLQTERLIVC
jgi:hypothetical protein